MNFPPPTPKQARVIWICATTLAVAVLMVLGGLFIWGLGWVLHKLSAVLVPMVFALILAYILDPVVEFFERKRVPRMWAVSLVFGLAVLVLFAVLGSVLPGLRRESRKLIDDLPKHVELIRSKTEAFLNDNTLGRQLPATWRQSLQSAVSQSQTNSHGVALPPIPTNVPEVFIGPPITNTVTTDTNLNVGESASGSQTTNSDMTANTKELASDLDAPLSRAVIPGLTNALVVIMKWFRGQLSKISTWAEFLIGFILVPVYLFYFLLEKQAITSRWPDYLPLKPSRTKDETIFVLRAINDCMIVFFRGQVLVALCVGVLLAAGYVLLGLNYAVLLGLVAAVLGIVPYLGTITSLLLALIVAGVQFQDWMHPLCVLGIAAVVKLLEDFVIGPRIIGERAGLHPLTIILAVMIGTTLLGGFVGALLAIPLTAALRTLMFRYIWIREHPRAKPAEARESVATK